MGEQFVELARVAARPIQQPLQGAVAAATVQQCIHSLSKRKRIALMLCDEKDGIAFD